MACVQRGIRKYYSSSESRFLVIFSSKHLCSRLHWARVRDFWVRAKSKQNWAAIHCVTSRHTYSLNAMHQTIDRCSNAHKWSNLSRHSNSVIIVSSSSSSIASLFHWIFALMSIVWFSVNVGLPSTRQYHRVYSGVSTTTLLYVTSDFRK